MAGSGSTSITTKSLGDAAEDLALAHLQRAGLRLMARNVKTPGRGGGEIDLVMRAPDGTVVFVEVRRRKSQTHGSAAASVDLVKQRRIVFAARHIIARMNPVPPCRFDVVTVEGPADRLVIGWIEAAFDAS